MILSAWKKRVLRFIGEMNTNDRRRNSIEDYAKYERISTFSFQNHSARKGLMFVLIPFRCMGKAFNSLASGRLG